MLISDFTTKYIIGFFFLTLSANFTTYYSLMYVLRHQKTPEGQAMRKKTQKFFTGMNIVYGLMIPLSVIPGTAPICSSLNIYPTTMFMCNVLFLANSGFFFYAQH